MSISSVLMSPITAPYNLVRRGVFSLIYPARFIRKLTAEEIEDKLTEKEIEDLDDGNNKINLRKAIANDTKNPFYMDIDSCMIYKKGTDVYDRNKQYIIHCDGNATCYEDMITTMASWCDESRNIVAFNPPGVKFSPGSTKGPEDYARALKCMIEHLHAQGIPYENITLSGRSLGAAISTMVANDYHRKNQRIKLFNDRSFANMADEAAVFVKNSIPTSILRATLGNFLYYFVKGAVRFFGLDFSPVKAFTEINTRHLGDARCIAVKGDRIVPHAQSLYARLSTNMRDKYADMYELQIKNKDDPHNYPLNLLSKQNSKITAEEYVMNSFDIYSPQTQILKQKSAQANELLGKIIEVTDCMAKIQRDGIANMLKPKLEATQKSLRIYHARIDAYLQQLLDHNKELITNQDPKAKQLNAMIDELISIARQVQVLLENTQKRIVTSPQMRKQSIFFRKKATIVPQEAPLEIDMKQINEQMDQFASKFANK